MGPIGAQEMMFIFLLALLLFGPKKLPELGRMLGKGLTEFRRAKNELKSTFETHMQELEREARLTETPAETPKWEQSSSSSPYTPASYPYPYDEYGRQTSAEETAASPASDAAPEGEHSRAEPVPGTVPRSSAAVAEEPVSAASDHERSA